MNSSPNRYGSRYARKLAHGRQHVSAAKWLALAQNGGPAERAAEADQTAGCQTASRAVHAISVAARAAAARLPLSVTATRVPAVDRRCLEDAGEFLAPDAKHLNGQALSRLLNVCDGVLGEAMRVLVLVTTNEPPDHLHPALVRPGRCLADVAFERFDRTEIVHWCSAHGVDRPDIHAASLADLYANLDGRPPTLKQPGFGFAPTAA